MKTLNEIFTFENLLNAHKRTRCCKQHKRETVRFEMNLAENLLSLREDILNNTYSLTPYRTFEIYEPKRRIIEALPYKHRVVQNCLCHEELMAVIEKKLIYDNCACRIGKGTHFALSRLKKFMHDYHKKFGTQGYFLKCDVKKYFANIDHEVLEGMLKKCEFSQDVFNFLSLIIKSNNQTKGLPIGNQSSQWFGLIYLNPIDRLIKEKFGIKYYVRYMDDLIVIHNDKNYLKNLLLEIIHYGKALKLEFNSKTCISKLNNGIEFLGFKHYLMKNGSVKSFLKHSAKSRLKSNIKVLFKLKEVDSIFKEQFLPRYKCLKEHLSYGDTSIYFNRLLCKI